MKMESINKKAGLSQLRRKVKAIALLSDSSYLEICDEIGEILGKSGDIIQDWLQDSSSHKFSASEINKFVNYSMSHLLDLDRKWAEYIFSCFCFSFSLFSRDVFELCNQRDAIKSFISVPRHAKTRIPFFIEQFLSGIRNNAQQYANNQFNHHGKSGFFIHHRLELNAVNRNNNEKKNVPTSIRADDLLFTEGVFAIVGSPGSGKTTLFWHLCAILANKDRHGLIPIPIDLEGIPPSVDEVEFLTLAIRQNVRDVLAHEIQIFARYLDKCLREGTAVLLADNWSSEFKGLPNTFKGWKRILFFSKYVPFHPDNRIVFYKLPELSDSDIRLFIKSWLFSSRQYADSELLFSNISSSREVNSLARIPLFLNLICASFYTNSRFLIGRWQLIDASLEIFLGKHGLSDQEVFAYRRFLSRLALSGYSKRDPNTGIRRQFTYADIEMFLWPTDRHQIDLTPKKIVEHGFLRPIHGGALFSFPHSEIQAALAAEALLNDPFWDAWIPFYKDIPAWGDVIVYAVAQLGALGDLERLVKLLGLIENFQDKIIPECHLLLLCRCFAELEESIRNKLERRDIGRTFITRIMSFLHSRSSTFFYEIFDLLPRLMTTDLETELIRFFSHWNCNDLSRCMIVRILGYSKSSLAVKSLGEFALYEKEDHGLRAEAILALGKTRHAEAIPILNLLLQDQSVFSYVVTALVNHNSVESMRSLLSTEKTLYWDPSAMSLFNPEILSVLEGALCAGEQHLLFILQAISSIGTDDSVLLLERFLYKKDTFSLAARLLRNITLPEANEVLLRFAEDYRTSRYDRFTALENIPCDIIPADSRRLLNLLFPTDTPAFSCGAIEALRKNSDINLPDLLIAEIVESSEQKRSTLLSIMISQNRPEYIPVYRRLFQDPDPFIRSKAIYGLAKTDKSLDPAVVTDELRFALENNLIPDYLCQAAGELRIKESVPLLAKLFLRRSWDGNCCELSALQDIGGPESAKVLLSAKHLWWSGEDSIFYNSDLIFQTLGELGEPIGLQTILDCGNSQCAINKEFSTGIINTLMRVHNPFAAPFLLEALGHPNPEVRHNSIISLAQMGYEKAIPKIIALLSDEVDYVRDMAYTAITRTYKSFENPDAVAALEELFQSADDRLWYAALIGLGNARRDLIHFYTLERMRQIIKTEPQDFLFRETLGTYAESGDNHTFQYIWDMRSNVGKCVGLSMDFQRRERDLFMSLGRIRFLPFLINKLPETRPLLKKICEECNIRVLENGTVVLPEGQELSADNAVKFLWHYSKQ